MVVAKKKRKDQRATHDQNKSFGKILTNQLQTVT